MCCWQLTFYSLADTKYWRYIPREGFCHVIKMQPQHKPKYVAKSTFFFIQCTNKSLKKGVGRNSQLHLCIWYDTQQQSVTNLVIATQVKCCRTYRSSYSSGHDISESDKDITACVLLIQKEVITEWEKKFKITGVYTKILILQWQIQCSV